MRKRWCFIDGCRKEATLILHTAPDDTLLCDEHRVFYNPDEDDLPAEPCEGDSCWCTDEFPTT